MDLERDFPKDPLGIVAEPYQNGFGPSFGKDPFAFVDVFQQIINGLPEQIALVDEHWNILAVNDAWTRTAALYGYHALTPGANYLTFCEDRALEGHKPAEIAANGIRMMDRNSEPSFRYVYHGSDRWEGYSFQLCVNRLDVGGRTFATITRYDVTELVQLRHLREDFTHSIIAGQDQERRRIAREVHDSTMQLLAGLGLSLGQLKRLRRSKSTTGIVDEMEQLLGEAQRELRAISFLAHPPLLKELGLVSAMKQLCGGFARRTGLNIAFHGEDDLELSSAAEVAVYRIVQEALSNIHRHARATDAAVGLYRRHSILHVAIADNGSGMPEHIRKGVGVSSMRERINEVGGRLMIRRGDPGTILIASVPVHPDLRTVGGMALRGGPALSQLVPAEETAEHPIEPMPGPTNLCA